MIRQWCVFLKFENRSCLFYVVFFYWFAASIINGHFIIIRDTLWPIIRLILRKRKIVADCHSASHYFRLLLWRILLIIFPFSSMISKMAQFLLTIILWMYFCIMVRYSGSFRESSFSRFPSFFTADDWLLENTFSSRNSTTILSSAGADTVFRLSHSAFFELHPYTILLILPFLWYAFMFPLQHPQVILPVHI